MASEKDQHLTRQTLLARLKLQRDDESWEEFVLYYRHFIYIICRRMNQNHHDAEEITQKILLKIWNAIESFEYDKNRRFRSWLYQVTRNAVRDHCRKQTRDKGLLEKASEYKIWNTGNDFDLPVIEQLAEEEWNNYLTNLALDLIRPHFSENVMLIFTRLINGAEASPLAKELGIPRNTVNVYKKRVMKKLKEELSRLKYELD
jgi:RNA polymerase sigma factor (sigma-70 family)